MAYHKIKVQSESCFNNSIDCRDSERGEDQCAEDSLNCICFKCRRDSKTSDSNSVDRTQVEENSKKSSRNIRKSKKNLNLQDDSPVTYPKVPDLRLLSDEINVLRQEITNITENFSCLSSSMSFADTKLNEIHHQWATTQERIKNFEFWEIEIAFLKSQVARLQKTLRNEIELIGIPEIENENLIDYVLLAAAKLGIILEEADIDWVTRVGSKHFVESGRWTGRPLVIRFVRRFKRDEFFQAAKISRDLSTADLNCYNIVQRVYVNERLTRENRYLFHEARNRSKEAGYKFCWTQNGHVFVCKREGFPAIRVQSHYDLVEKLKPSQSTSNEFQPNPPEEN